MIGNHFECFRDGDFNFVEMVFQQDGPADHQGVTGKNSSGKREIEIFIFDYIVLVGISLQEVP